MGDDKADEVKHGNADNIIMFPVPCPPNALTTHTLTMYRQTGPITVLPVGLPIQLLVAVLLLKTLGPPAARVWKLASDDLQLPTEACLASCLGQYISGIAHGIRHNEREIDWREK